MNDIKTFVAHLLEKEKEILEEDYLLFQKEEQERLNNQKQLISQRLTLQKDKVSNQLESQATIEEARLNNQKRNQILLAKQEQLNHIFDKALNEMINWPQEKTQAFLTHILQKNDIQKKCTLFMGELTKIKVDLPDHVLLSPEVIANEAGFILEFEDVTYNFLYSSILNEVKKDFMGDLSRKIK